MNPRRSHQGKMAKYGSATLMSVARVNRVSIGFARSARAQRAQSPADRRGARRLRSAGAPADAGPDHGPADRAPRRAAGGRLLVLLVLLVLRATTNFRCQEGSCYTAGGEQEIQ